VLLIGDLQTQLSSDGGGTGPAGFEPRVAGQAPQALNKQPRNMTGVTFVDSRGRARLYSFAALFVLYPLTVGPPR
jgi:hypothetical protein